MKPVLVLQHLDGDGPAYLATWLARRGVQMDLRCTEAGAAFPDDTRDHGAVAVLGGAMSANDPLPSLQQAERLILDAMGRGVPVIGHCLGGQLMARALGAAIGPSPRPEVGWHAVDWEAAATGWFGASVKAMPAPQVFQWHYEAFGLPRGATNLAGNAACPHQAFAIGPHLAMQFHVEVDHAKLTGWTGDLDADYDAAAARDPGHVQTPAAMWQRASERLAAQQALASAAYERWLSAVRV